MCVCVCVFLRAHMYVYMCVTSPLNTGTLPYLLQACFVLDQGLVSLLLALILTALSGIPSKPEGREVVLSNVLGSGHHKKKAAALKEEEKLKKEHKAAASKDAKEKPKPG